MQYSNCTAILFDVGHTLVRPKSGSWILPPRYPELLGDEMLHVMEHQPEAFEQATKRALQYLMDNHHAKTEAEEYEQFRKFYAMIYDDCGQKVEQSLIDALAREEVYDVDKFVWFDDVAPMLKELRGHYTLGVVSDTWPSLESIFVAHRLRDYFSTFVMSSVYGVTKAEPTLFEIALDELQLAPDQALFIDDLESNLIVADNAGLKPILIDRYESQTAQQSAFPMIRSLEELRVLLGC